jgi:hypothetical protein
MTLIELLEAIAAIELGGLLAEKLSSPFHGIWHALVLWTIRTVGSGIIFVLLLYGFGYLFDYLRRRKALKQVKYKDNSN